MLIVTMALVMVLDVVGCWRRSWWRWRWSVSVHWRVVDLLAVLRRRAGHGTVLVGWNVVVRLLRDVVCGHLHAGRCGWLVDHLVNRHWLLVPTVLSDHVVVGLGWRLVVPVPVGPTWARGLMLGPWLVVVRILLVGAGLVITGLVLRRARVDALPNGRIAFGHFVLVAVVTMAWLQVFRLIVVRVVAVAVGSVSVVGDRSANIGVSECPNYWSLVIVAGVLALVITAIVDRWTRVVLSLVLVVVVILAAARV